MNFKDTLNNHLNILNCSAKQLSDKTGLSQTVISRYKNGERTPKINGVQLEKIITAIYELSIDNNINTTLDDITEIFINSINNNSYNNDIFIQKLNYLIKFLDISVSDMCQYIPFSTSYISKVKNKKVIVKDYDYFIDCISKYIVEYYSNFTGKKLVSDLLELDIDKVNDSSSLLIQIKDWFKSNDTKFNDTNTYMNNFLHTLNDFNLNDYIKSIKFDELKVPYVPFYNVKCKNYYGIEEMKKGELDFFKAAVLIKQNDEIFMCSNMPMEDMALDIEFGKKWMYAIAMSIKKGMHINIIHNVNRPFNEMMLGLESWIPIYMTGQVSPYYLNYETDKAYQHLTYVSSTVALTGECTFNKHDEGKYYLTNKKEEVRYYKNKADILLSNAKPLMDMYTKSNIEEYKLFLKTIKNINCNINITSFSLPLFTINNDTLNRILKYNKLDNEEIKRIMEYKEKISKYYMSVIENNELTIKINHDEKNKIMRLDIDPLIFDKEIYYKEKEYNEHLLLTKEFASNYISFNLEFMKDNTFDNIKIISYDNNFVIISKLSNPKILFIIKHPKLRKAIECFKSSIVE